MPQPLEPLLHAGSQYLHSGRLDEAKKLADALLANAPESREVHLFAADVADAAGDARAALRHLEAVPADQLNWAPLLLRRAQFELAARLRPKSVASMRAAAACIETDAWQLRTLARLESENGEVDSARGHLLIAHEKYPHDPAVTFDLAVAEFQLDHVDAAERLLTELLERQPLHSGALHLRSALRTQTAESNHVEDLKALLARSGTPASVLAAGHYALAKELEDLGQYRASFAALERGAKAYRTLVKYDARNEVAALAAIRHTFSREVFESLGPGCETGAPIFVIGMPRTGTTLVERLLSSHSDVASVGELKDFPFLLAQMTADLRAESGAGLNEVELSLRLDFRTLGERYLEAARAIAPGAPFVVDKLPYNYIYCGYILAALPNAKIVHLTRDPLDTCYAVYKTLFFNAYSYSYDLSELGGYYVAYRQQMNHWHKVLPNRILDVAYEDLVREPADQAKRIVEWCGLPWQDAVLDYHTLDRPAMTASAAQVRRAPHTESIGAWRRVAFGLQGLADALARAGVKAAPSDEA